MPASSSAANPGDPGLHLRTGVAAGLFLYLYYTRRCHLFPLDPCCGDDTPAGLVPGTIAAGTTVVTTATRIVTAGAGPQTTGTRDAAHRRRTIAAGTTVGGESPLLLRPSTRPLRLLLRWRTSVADACSVLATRNERRACADDERRACARTSRRLQCVPTA
eukprot:1192529-Prorocentrum_minimum.AAC.2